MTRRELLALPCLAAISSAIPARENPAMEPRRSEILDGLVVWETPQDGKRYTVGVDVSEGIGIDYSVAFVNLVGEGPNPDEQVATLRSNRIDPIYLAKACDWLGRWYNDALMCVEYNGVGKLTADVLVFQYHYPNLYRWKHVDSRKPLSKKWHWFTNADSKRRLGDMAEETLASGGWRIRSENFWREWNARKNGTHPYSDEIDAGMIALYCSQTELKGLTHGA